MGNKKALYWAGGLILIVLIVYVPRLYLSKDRIEGSRGEHWSESFRQMFINHCADFVKQSNFTEKANEYCACYANKIEPRNVVPTVNRGFGELPADTKRRIMEFVGSPEGQEFHRVCMNEVSGTIEQLATPTLKQKKKK